MGPLEALRRISDDLTGSQVPFALVGGLAVTARSEPRFTRDVDVCVAVQNDAQAEQLLFQLRARDYSVVATVEQVGTGRLATARLRSPSGIVCDLLFALSGIEHDLISRSTTVEIAEGFSVPVATAEDLLALKVLSVVPERHQDLGDIHSLLQNNPHVVSDDVASRLRIIESRGYHRDQDLQRKWRDILAQRAESSE